MRPGRPGPLLGRLATVLLLLAALLGLSACGAPALPLDTWTLDDVPLQLPAHLGDRVGRAPSFTLRSRVVVPPSMRGGPLTLAITWLPARVELRVDGRIVPPLDLPLSDRYRSSGPHRWRLPDDASTRDAVDLELVVDDTWTQATWLDDVPRLSATTGGDATFLAVDGFDLAASLLCVPTIAILTLLYAALWLRDRTRRENGWFALEGAGALWYPALMSGVLQPVFGRAEVAVAAPLLSLSAVATVHFTHAYLRLPRPSRAWWAAFAGITVASALKGGPFEATRWSAAPTAVLVAATAAYHLGLLRRILRSGARPTNLLIVTLSWPLATMVAATDFASWLGLGDPFGGVRAGSLGILSVAALQSIALAIEHAKSMREVVVLNEELRRQVAARSSQLADALARLGAAAREAPELSPGQDVDGRYRVVKELGHGGAGRVYEVERKSDGRRLALKVVKATTDAMTLARAAREAQLASEVKHENVVAIVDVDVATEGFFFLVMELVDGRSLRDERARFGDAAWALPILRQIARGLAAIHARGIVHRDLKPANVLLAGPEGDTAAIVKIADFGIANLAPARPAPSVPPPAGEDAPTVQEAAPAAKTEATITATGDLLGTPHYMAPEIVPLGMKAARPAADIFAFGVLAFEMLAGRRPYEPTPTFLGLAVAGPPPPFATIAPTLPPSTATLLDACLSRDPTARPTAAQLVDALRD